jgi:hypothetical protein
MRSDTRQECTLVTSEPDSKRSSPSQICRTRPTLQSHQPCSEGGSILIPKTHCFDRTVASNVEGAVVGVVEAEAEDQEYAACKYYTNSGREFRIHSDLPPAYRHHGSWNRCRTAQGSWVGEECDGLGRRHS